jgi:hypothetical protein
MCTAKDVRYLSPQSWGRWERQSPTRSRASACPQAGQSHTANAASAYVSRRLSSGAAIVPATGSTRRSTPQPSQATPTASVVCTVIARPPKPASSGNARRSPRSESYLPSACRAPHSPFFERRAGTTARKDGPAAGSSAAWRTQPRLLSEPGAANSGDLTGVSCDAPTSAWRPPCPSPGLRLATSSG